MNSIVIVDDHQLFAEGLRNIIDKQAGIAVKAICTSGRELMRISNSIMPALVLMDIKMPDMDGLETCKKLKLKCPTCKVVFITMFDGNKVIADCKKAGADGYIHKSTDAQIVISAILDILRGEQVFLKAEFNNIPQESIETNKEIFSLTVREKEIIAMIKTGNTTKLIAKELSISEYTVETHRKNINKKLEIRSLSELILFAAKNGL